MTKFENRQTDFFGLAQTKLEEADVAIVPAPYEGTVCYGKGTSRGPDAILRASTHIELWDEETDFNYESLKFHVADTVDSSRNDSPEDYSKKLSEAARKCHRENNLVVGIGGEHGITPALVQASVENPDDLSGLTVVQFDAHSDLRDSYSETMFSHACAMRRLVERGAKVIAIGIRSADKAEFEYGLESKHVQTFFSQKLFDEQESEQELLNLLRNLTGDVYLTFDVDAWEVDLCPGTGTPLPGGLSWWQSMRYLRALLLENRSVDLKGCDVVECVPQKNSQVNEISAARLITKMIAYRFK